MFLKKRIKLFVKVINRILFWYTLIIAVVSLGVFFIVYSFLASSLGKQIDKHLVEESNEILELYRLEGLRAVSSEILVASKSHSEDYIFFRLITPNMEILTGSEMMAWLDFDLWPEKFSDFNNSEGLPVSLLLSIKDGLLETHSDHQREFDVRTFTITTHNGNILEMGISLRENQLLLRNYTLIFSLALILMVVSGGLAVRFLTSKMMHGIENVAKTATIISSGDYTQRVELKDQGQEIDELITAFNNMITKVHSTMQELKKVSNNIAHDLRNPITRIRGLAETTLSSATNCDEFKEMTGSVIGECDNLIVIVNTMLDIAETDAGVAQLKQNPLDISIIVKEAYELFRPVAEEKSLDFIVKNINTPLMVKGDKSLLQRAVANLIDNSIKYTPSNGEIVISLDKFDSYARITFNDSGIGIDQKHLEDIFKRFFRVDKSRTLPGNGLGLSLANSIVRAHKGEINVTSEPRKGSTFTLLLPRL